ncbi:MAG TPA: hypothetical protein PK747_01535 [Acidobacteriota bacterium]|jgi:hypothetical protein|nr:hypothetical protein [Acidobacteriota bacterium]HNT17094.1 hypothetical protein [Acidobacteriota bacterium]HPA26106.1 hypothetical protein [Acidobacteriota bacterium]HQO19261.1 hypothetical protein [Acidobacteriota bacterium]HQQ46073.1 hypothetical protein [Acidobacteriota bacterium]
MAEYLFLDIGAEWDLAFPFREAARVYHSFEEVFPQLIEEAVDLPAVFEKGASDDRPRVVLKMTDNSAFVGFNSYIQGQGEIAIFPLAPILFRGGRAWAKAVLIHAGKISFSVNKEVLGELADE